MSMERQARYLKPHFVNPPRSRLTKPGRGTVTPLQPAVLILSDAIMQFGVIARNCDFWVWQKGACGLWPPSIGAQLSNLAFPIWDASGEIIDETPSFNPVFAPNRVPRVVFGLAEYVMPSIWLQTAKITAC
jgi:hypothetical protein